MVEATLAGRRVLVVEDEYYLADDLARALATAGATVLGPAPSVAAALDLLAQEPALEAAVLDVNLGGEMVYAVADMLAVRGIPYIYATGYDETVIPERYSAAPRAQKPIDPRHVIDTLAKLIGASALARSFSCAAGEREVARRSRVG